jgi:hypothetical protein
MLFLNNFVREFPRGLEDMLAMPLSFVNALGLPGNYPFGADRTLLLRAMMPLGIEALDGSAREIVLLQMSGDTMRRAIEPVFNAAAGTWKQEVVDWSSTPCRVYSTASASVLGAATNTVPTVAVTDETADWGLDVRDHRAVFDLSAVSAGKTLALVSYQLQTESEIKLYRNTAGAITILPQQNRYVGLDYKPIPAFTMDNKTNRLVVLRVTEDYGRGRLVVTSDVRASLP